jgi:excinuclease ABC subunit B
MYRGDRARKQTLVSYGFRLPSAMDNRPLKFEEFTAKTRQVIYISATPSDYELELSREHIIEQIVRPTGLLDPVIDVRSAQYQIDDLYEEICHCVDSGERVLVTTLTKRMSEDLSDYFTDLGLKVRYLHSDINTLERIDIIRDLRSGLFDVLIGINLLREGLDIPEVSLVAILDADKEGFLRSSRSLIQTCGRAARNAHGKVIMYADRNTKAMQQAIDETERRRAIQQAFNVAHDITPTTIRKTIANVFDFVQTPLTEGESTVSEAVVDYETTEDLDIILASMEKEMKAASKALAFEKAATLRDRIRELRKIQAL